MILADIPQNLIDEVIAKYLKKDQIESIFTGEASFYGGRVISSLYFELYNGEIIFEITEDATLLAETEYLRYGGNEFYEVSTVPKIELQNTCLDSPWLIGNYFFLPENGDKIKLDIAKELEKFAILYKVTLKGCEVGIDKSLKGLYAELSS